MLENFDIVSALVGALAAGLPMAWAWFREYAKKSDAKWDNIVVEAGDELIEKMAEKAAEKTAAKVKESQ